MTFTDTTVAIFHRSRLYSSIKDTRTPPTNEAMMLYRNAPSVDIAVIMMTSLALTVLNVAASLLTLLFQLTRQRMLVVLMH